MWGGNSTTWAFIISSFSFLSSPPPPVVVTKFGEIEGERQESRNGRPFFAFKGVPFAEPPVGNLRFRPPIPWNKTWEGVRDGTSYGNRCVQYHLLAKFLTGDEDCLILNVYTHNFQKKNKGGEIKEYEDELHPVVVYIHGGLFMQGSSAFYKPIYFMDKDVVLVTIQYRVGALGFLNMENEDVQGNMGLKDQVVAMRWVKENIDAFGGDPDKITIMGESAGGVSVHGHMLSPMSRGLFHRAISQSGTTLMSWALRADPLEQAKIFAKSLNCPTSSKADMAACLRQVDAVTIARAHMDAAHILQHDHALFGPTVETWNFTGESEQEAFLPAHPSEIIISGSFSKVPWICGANSEEGLVYAAPLTKNDTVRDAFNSNWTYWAPRTFGFQKEANCEALAQAMREHYLGSANISMDSLPNLVRFITDQSFFEGLHHTLALHKGQHPIYPYIYSYHGEFSFGRLVLGMSFNLPVFADVLFSASWRWLKENILGSSFKDYGTTHGDELPLMFNLPFQDVHTEDSPDYQMSATLIDTWTYFMEHGVPPLVKEVKWPCLQCPEDNLENGAEDDKPMKFLRLDKTVELIDEPFAKEIHFWKSLNMSYSKRFYEFEDSSAEANLIKEDT